MDRKIKFIQYGCGKMSVYSMRYAINQGCEIVGAIDIDPDIIGKDVSEIMNVEIPIGVKITDIKDAEKLLIDTKPDICIITTMSLMKDVEDAFMLCARLGINAISTCEEAFYPWNSSPEMTAQIDSIAKANNCTISGSGYQDVFWGNLITSIAGATHNITKIKGSSSYNVEEYGIALANAHGAGFDIDRFNNEIASSDNISEEERKKLIESGDFLPSYMWNVCGWICSQLGLSVISQVQKCIPQIAEEEIYSSTLDMTIPKGNATGMSAIVTTTTKEGITIEAECIGKVYTSNDFDKNEWTVYGEPDTTLVINRPSTVELTCATIVNRIPDIINAKPGYITTDSLIKNSYKVKQLNEYIN